ncbi:isochorismatase hydrolase [Galbibacter marinus]|uniref:Isochorismatase hydrolase n=2 Tax=Galbibacter marinus TaxID=555500 RepID=K2PSK7_9FLAO|nr:isochorismatase hydrolase [Galbibacter marinus]
MKMSKKALIVIDIQNDYFENGAWELVGANEASLKAQKMINHFRENNLPIAHIQHFAVEGNIPFFHPGTPGVEIHNNVKPLEGEKVVKKNYPNSFRDTDLMEYLKENDVSEVVITGMMSHMCVDATTRAAKDFGFDCTVISDACASKDQELDGKLVKAADVHTAFLAALTFFYARITTAEGYISA